MDISERAQKLVKRAPKMTTAAFVDESCDIIADSITEIDRLTQELEEAKREKDASAEIVYGVQPTFTCGNGKHHEKVKFNNQCVYCLVEKAEAEKDELKAYRQAVDDALVVSLDTVTTGDAKADLHKLLGHMIEQGHARKKVCINKDTFQHPLERDGVVILQVETAQIESYEMVDDDGFLKEGSCHTSLVLGGGEG